MHIFVKVANNRTMTLRAKATDTVASVKSKIQHSTGYPQEQQILLFCGYELDDARTLLSHGVQDIATLHLATRFPLQATAPLAEGRAALAQQLAIVEHRAAVAETGWMMAEAARSEWASAALQLGWRPRGEATMTNVEDAPVSS